MRVKAFLVSVAIFGTILLAVQHYRLGNRPSTGQLVLAADQAYDADLSHSGSRDSGHKEDVWHANLNLSDFEVISMSQNLSRDLRPNRDFSFSQKDVKPEINTALIANLLAELENVDIKAISEGEFV